MKNKANSKEVQDVVQTLIDEMYMSEGEFSDEEFQKEIFYGHLSLYGKESVIQVFGVDVYELRMGPLSPLEKAIYDVKEKK